MDSTSQYPSSSLLIITIIINYLYNKPDRWIGDNHLRDRLERGIIKYFMSSGYSKITNAGTKHCLPRCLEEKGSGKIGCEHFVFI